VLETGRYLCKSCSESGIHAHFDLARGRFFKLAWIWSFDQFYVAVSPGACGGIVRFALVWRQPNGAGHAFACSLLGGVGLQPGCFFCVSFGVLYYPGVLAETQLASHLD